MAQGVTLPLSLKIERFETDIQHRMLRHSVLYLLWIRRASAKPVEVSRKKALALSIERSESRITIQKLCMHSMKTADARMRAAGHLMQVKKHSVHL